MGFTRFYWVLLGFTGFYWVLPGFTGFHWVSLGFIGFLLGFTGFYWVLLGFTGFYWVLLGFTGFYRVSLGFIGFLLGFTGFFNTAKSVSSKSKTRCRLNGLNRLRDGVRRFGIAATDFWSWYDTPPATSISGSKTPSTKNQSWNARTTFDWVSWCLAGFYRVILGFTGFHWVLHWIFTGFYWVIMGFKRLLLAFTEFQSFLRWVHWVSLGYTRLNGVLLGFHGYQTGFTGCYLSWIAHITFDWFS